MSSSSDGTPPRDPAPRDAGQRRGREGRSRTDTEPTVLLVGADKSFHTAIAAALGRHGVYVETSSLHGIVDAVVAAAPDLVLLVGDAAMDGGSSALAHLHTSPQSSVVPVAILADDTALDERLRAFRHGAAAVIPRSASVEAIAERVEKLAREIPERDGDAVGYIGEATLDELVAALSKELRSGILSVRGPAGSDVDTLRVVLGGGRPLAQTIDEFVSRIRKHVVHAEPLHYEFDERAGGTIQMLGADALDHTGTGDDVSGLRVLLADEDAARADAIAQALRARDVSVVVTDFDPPEQRFARLRQLDPAILLIDEAGLRKPGFQLVRRMRRDTRLRWASLLVVRWDEIWSETEGGTKIARTLGTLAALAEPERALVERVERGTPFDTRLEITGPARLLRALATSSKPIRLVVQNPRAQVRVDLSDHLVAGARAELEGEPAPAEGAVALAALLVLGSGRVHVERLSEAELVNVMSPVDVALNLADCEPAPIHPSLPAPEPDVVDDAPVARTSLAAALKRRRVPIWFLAAGLTSVLAGIVIAASIASPRAAKSHSETADDPTANAVTPALAVSLAAPAPQVAPVAALPTPSVAPAASPRVPTSSARTENAPPTNPSAMEEATPADVSGETTTKVQTCEQIVGPSWSLLSSDQPGRALNEIGLGRRALMLGRLDDAQQSFCRATVLDPNNPEGFLALTRVLLARKDAEQARDWAARAAKVHPDDADVEGLYADALARAGDADRARSIWLELGKIDPSDGAAIRTMAAMYVRAGERSVHAADYAQADRFYRRAVLLDPLNATAAAGLARVLLVQGEPAAALSWAKRAVSLDLHDGDLHVLLGDVEERNGDTAGARAEWKAAYDIDPRNFKAASRMLRVGK
jgi:DNA-binding NarL/FixJ family response regulator/Flp pilus assembly protein TadD